MAASTFSPHRRSGLLLETGLGVIAVCFVAFLLVAAPVTAAVSVNASAYGNDDFEVNTLTSGQMIVMMSTNTPSTFDAYAFTKSAYNLYAAADTAIVNASMVQLVGWCAKAATTLNSSIACLDGTKYNNNASYPYVFLQVRLVQWAGSTYANPTLVSLSSLNVIEQLAVNSFAGTSNPDKNTSYTSATDYITTISYNTAAVYAVFGVLLAVVVISLIVMCVCICRSDNAMANVNRSLIDKAISKFRNSSHHGSSHNAAAHGGQETFSQHFNLKNNSVVVGPVPASPSQPLPPSPVTVPTSVVNTYSPREGDVNHQNEREMKDAAGAAAVVPSSPAAPQPPQRP